MRCTFVPPYLLRQLATAADGLPIDHTLELDDRLRARRDAASPTITQPATTEGATRVIYDAKGGEDLPGEAVRRDADPPTGDLAVDEAFDYSALVWDLFAQVFNRRSVDGNGTALSVTVHFSRNYDNAFWDGQQLVFGDGDGKIFDRFTKPVDVMAHEITHGVTQFTARLAYQGQSGALNESVSDVFATLTKQRWLGQSVDQADWLIGQGLFLPGVNAKGIRSMTEPGTAYDDPRIGKDPQVGSMADYVDTEADSGGVHINSGIPNRAFALAALGVGGRSWEQAGQIWYDAITSGEVNTNSDFAAFARATVSSAGRLFAADPRIVEQVRLAWTTVGVLGSADPAPVVSAPSAADIGARVAVRRTGGFVGATQAAELDLDSDPDGPEVRYLLTTMDLDALSVSPPAPDRFVYEVEFGPHRLSVPEQDLTPELHQVVQIVLSSTQRGLDL